VTSTLLWARLDNGYVWLVLFVTLAFGLIGFADDYAKVSQATATAKGVSGRVRLRWASPSRGSRGLGGRAAPRGAASPAGLPVLQGRADQPRAGSSSPSRCS
jgi:hypothetical protein